MPKVAGGPRWLATLEEGLGRWCADAGSCTAHGVHVRRLRPRCPILLTSGTTPGPFYHSHPHVPAEFDHLKFDMASQVRENARTLRAIADSVQATALPFELSGPAEFARRPLLVHWVSNRGAGFTANAEQCEQLMGAACAAQGLDLAEQLAVFETGRNVSDGRFLLETFGMFGLEGAPVVHAGSSVRLDLHGLFDWLDEERSVYTVGQKQYFMPYVPGYLACGQADLAVFRVSAASGERTVPACGGAQIETALTKLCNVLGALGAGFENMLLLWNRVADLDADEEAALMTRSRMGLPRPLAESLLELGPGDTNGSAPDGTAIAAEYIAVAQVPMES